MHEYTKTFIQFNILNSRNNTTTNIIDTISAHSMKASSGYNKQSLLNLTMNIVQL